jgi:hypothetical protein
MNDARRKEIQRAQALIGEAKGILEVAATQEQDDFDKMPQDLQNDDAGEERRRWLTHWSLLQCAVTRRFPLARSQYRVSTSIADEMSRPARVVT